VADTAYGVFRGLVTDTAFGVFPGLVTDTAYGFPGAGARHFFGTQGAAIAGRGQ